MTAEDSEVTDTNRLMLVRFGSWLQHSRVRMAGGEGQGPPLLLPCLMAHALGSFLVESAGNHQTSFPSCLQQAILLAGPA